MTVLLELPESLCVADLAALHPDWLSALDARPQADCVAAARVLEMDGAGVQMLMALAATLAARDLQLRLLEPSVTVRTALTRLGWSVPIVTHEEVVA